MLYKKLHRKIFSSLASPHHITVFRPEENFDGESYKANISVHKFYREFAKIMRNISRILAKFVRSTKSRKANIQPNRKALHCYQRQQQVISVVFRLIFRLLLFQLFDHIHICRHRQKQFIKSIVGTADICLIKHNFSYDRVGFSGRIE